MTSEQKFKELYPQFVCGNEPLSPFFDLFENGYEIGQVETKVNVRKDLCLACKDYYKKMESEGAVFRNNAKDIISCLLQFIDKETSPFARESISDVIEQAERLLE